MAVSKALSLQFEVLPLAPWLATYLWSNVSTSLIMAFYRFFYKQTPPRHKFLSPSSCIYPLLYETLWRTNFLKISFCKLSTKNMLFWCSFSYLPTPLFITAPWHLSPFAMPFDLFIFIFLSTSITTHLGVIQTRSATLRTELQPEIGGNWFNEKFTYITVSDFHWDRAFVQKLCWPQPGLQFCEFGITY